MNKKFIFIIPIGFVLAVILIALLVGEPEKPAPNQKLTHLNLCILLDLSDRISPDLHPGQIQRDLDIIKEITSIYEEQVKKKLYIGSKDAIQIALAPQPLGDPSSTLTVSGRLRIDMGRTRTIDKRRGLPGQIKGLLDDTEKMYSEASKNPEYIGADIWGFFKNDIDSYLVSSSEDNVRNIIVILTDGLIEFEKSKNIIKNRPTEGRKTSYMSVDWFVKKPYEFAQFDSKGYGLIPIKKDAKNAEIFKNTEILVLEITPKDILNTREAEVIQKYWEKWFAEMEIKKSRLQRHQPSITPTIKVLQEFIAPGAPVHVSTLEPEASSSPAKARESVATLVPSPTPSPPEPPKPAIEFVSARVQMTYTVLGKDEKPFPEGTQAIFYKVRVHPISGMEVSSKAIEEANIDSQGYATFKSVPCDKPFKIVLGTGALGHKPLSVTRPQEYPNKYNGLKCEENVLIGKYAIDLPSEPLSRNRR